MGLVRLLKEAFQVFDNDCSSYSSILVKQVKETGEVARPFLEMLGLPCVFEGKNGTEKTQLCHTGTAESFKALFNQVLQKLDPQSTMLSLPDLKECFPEYFTLDYSHTYNEITRLLTILTEKLQTAHDVDESLFSGSFAAQGFEKFDNVSDIIQDVIKSIKFLVTFEVKNGVHEELLIPHFNISSARNDITRQSVRRHIGAR